MTSAEPPKDIRVSRMFATPIVTYRIQHAESLNQRLARAILAAAALKPSTGRSNIGGWRSEPNLLDWPGEHIAQLLTEIQTAIQQTFAATSPEGGFNGMIKINAWANVLGKGNYNSVHNHPESAWSGVYYVDAGTADPNNPLSGILELLDPRPFVEMVSTPGTPFGRPVRIQAENGLMVLFPSWLYHHVHPYSGNGTRIAIAFNIPVLPSPSEGE